MGSDRIAIKDQKFKKNLENLRDELKKKGTVSSLEGLIKYLYDQYLLPKTVTTENVVSPPENNVPECPALLYMPKKGYVCSNKAPKITPIPDLLICKFCWERQQKLKTTTATPTQLSTSSIYKKPENIYCIKDLLWLNPLKFQTKCELCKLNTFSTWAECQRKQSIKTGVSK